MDRPELSDDERELLEAYRRARRAARDTVLGEALARPPVVPGPSPWEASPSSPAVALLPEPVVAEKVLEPPVPPARRLASPERTRLGLAVLGAALLLGLLGDAVLRVTPWGPSAALWVGALAVAAVGLGRFGRPPLAPGARWLLPLAVLLAAGLAWRDSPTLRALNVAGALVALGLVPVVRLRLLSVTTYLRALMAAGLNALGGAFGLVFGDIAWSQLPRPRSAAPLWAGLRGLAVALPLLLVFGALFASADAAFGELTGRVFSWDLGDLLTHAWVVLLGAWPAAGFLRWLGRVQAGEPVPPPIRRPGPSLGAVEVTVALAALALLFLAFVVVQLGYFFNPGGGLVAGLTYADYARRGFFELVAVAALALPVLLAADGLMRREAAWHERAYRLLAGAIVAMLFVVMASALRRMALYQSAYGLTELRLYTTAFMGLLAVVFVWFLATVLRGRRERFAFGALCAGFLTVVVLNAVNPDGHIARVNLERAAAGEAFDTGYLLELSADAVPALATGWASLPPNVRAELESAVLARWREEAPDWRTWNWGRERARAVASGL